MADQEQTRFRSFAERYVIERASGFKSDTDAWTAVQDAMRIYKMIQQQSVRASHQLEPTEDAQQQAGVGPWPGIWNGASGSAVQRTTSQGGPGSCGTQAMPILAASQIYDNSLTGQEHRK